jgi:hypothetical protein
MSPSAARLLPTWSNGAAKQAFLAFVARVTEEGGPGYATGNEWIAVLDKNDMLWCKEYTWRGSGSKLP